MKDDINDFGFSLISEEELKKHEDELRIKVEQQSKIVQQTTTDLTDKLHGLRRMIMPLLLNLTKDPEKTYVFWPDRAEKVKAFIDKVNNFVDD